MARDLQGAAFGEQLRHEREQRGLAVETICAATKVPVRHILSLEAGAFRDLPGGVFRRGFLRSYLSAVGLEEASWMARFEESCRRSGVRDPGENGWVTFAENVKSNRYTPRRAMRSPVRWVQLLLLVVVLAGASLWRVAGHFHLLPQPHFPRAVKTWVDKLPFR